MAKWVWRPNVRGELERNVRGDDGRGGRTENWQSIGHVHAMLTPLKSFRQVDAALLEKGVTHRLVFRKRVDVTASGWRYRIGTRVLEFDSGVIDVDEHGQFQEVTVKERPSQKLEQS